MNNRCFPLLALFISIAVADANAQSWPMVETVDRQPLLASILRLEQALDSVGRPLSESQKAELKAIATTEKDAAVVAELQKLLDPLCLVAIHINPESRVKVIEGEVPKNLIENGWSTFLVKIHNEAGINPPLRYSSPQAKPQYIRSNASPEPKSEITMTDVKDRWLDLVIANRQPMRSTLSGLELEYQIVQLHSRDEGKREATIEFNIGQGTQDLGFRNEVAILFECAPAKKVGIDVRDASTDEPMMVALEIRDPMGRVYPNPARRLAPDFFFHNQVYRDANESVSLPPGEYNVRISRGPEYLPLNRTLVVKENEKATISAKLRRWIDPVQWAGIPVTIMSTPPVVLITRILPRALARGT